MKAYFSQNGAFSTPSKMPQDVLGAVLTLFFAGAAFATACTRFAKGSDLCVTPHFSALEAA